MYHCRTPCRGRASGVSRAPLVPFRELAGVALLCPDGEARARNRRVLRPSRRKLANDPFGADVQCGTRERRSLAGFTFFAA